MGNPILISARSNCDFSLNYQTGTLDPKAEIIVITTYPQYTANAKKNVIEKSLGVKELRFSADLGSVNKLIGELQIVAENLNKFEQLASSFNSLIINEKESK